MIRKKLALPTILGWIFYLSVPVASQDASLKPIIPPWEESDQRPSVVLVSDDAPPQFHPLAKPIEWVTRSVEYTALCLQAYGMAWQAVKKAVAAQSQNWVVVLDVDDTVLQTWSYGKWLVESNSVYTPETWKEWVLRQQATPVPGAKQFLDRVRTLGPAAHIAFITDDKIDFEPVKIDTLRRLGLFRDGDIVLPKINREDTKEVRRQCLITGAPPRCAQFGPLVPIVFLGDSIRDHLPVGSRAQADLLKKRMLDGEPWCPIEAACILLPNPVYGPWESDYNQ